MPMQRKFLEEMNERIERRSWLIKIAAMEIECGLDPWYGDFSEWLREILIPGYKKHKILPHIEISNPFETEKVWR